MLATAFLRKINASAKLQAAQLLNSCVNCKNGLSYLHTSSIFRYVLQRIKGTSTNVTKRNFSKDLILDTDVTRNVLLYENQNQRQYTFLIATGFVQQLGWAIIAYNLYPPGMWKQWKEKKTFKEFFDQHAFRSFFVVWSAVIGPIILSVIWLLCSRSVKYIILHKGGKKVTLVTYNPVKSRAKMCLDAKDVKTSIKRSQVKVYMPMKVRGKPMFYLVDGKGQFFHGTLFDNTFPAMK